MSIDWGERLFYLCKRLSMRKVECKNVNVFTKPHSLRSNVCAQHVAPSGGSGGDGGNVIFTVDPSFNTLLGFRGRSNFKAEHGAEGAS